MKIVFFISMFFCTYLNCSAKTILISKRESHLNAKCLDTIKDKLYGLKIAILGDSVSLERGGGNAYLGKGKVYWKLLERFQQCTIVSIDAFPGTTIIKGGQGEAMSSIRRIKKIASEADVIFVFGGINDFLQRVELGSLGDKGNTTSFYGALDYMYNEIMKRNNKARVFHLTPLHIGNIKGAGASA